MNTQTNNTDNANTGPDIEGLEEVYRVTAALPNEKFSMRTWIRNDPVCGTVGCLIGNFCAAHPGDALQLALYTPVLVGGGGISGAYAVAKRFQIRVNDAYEVFQPEDEEGTIQNLTRLEALARLRSFITRLECEDQHHSTTTFSQEEEP